MIEINSNVCGTILTRLWFLLLIENMLYLSFWIYELKMRRTFRVKKRFSRYKNKKNLLEKSLYKNIYITLDFSKTTMFNITVKRLTDLL